AVYRQVAVNWDLTVGSSPTRTPPWWNNPANWTPAQTRIAVLVCPSDNPYDSAVGTIVRMHTWNTPPFSGYDYFTNGAGRGETLVRTNYVGVAGLAGALGGPSDAFTGVLSNRSGFTLEAITNGNGTGATRMFGETLGGHPTGPRDFSLAWI